MFLADIGTQTETLTWCCLLRVVTWLGTSPSAQPRMAPADRSPLYSPAALPFTKAFIVG